MQLATSWSLIRAAGRAALLLVGVAAALTLVVLVGGVDLLKPDDEGEGLGEFIEKVDAVKGPATVAFGSVSGVGLLAGAAMTGMGMQQGMRMMSMSALAGGGVLLGNGLIA